MASFTTFADMRCPGIDCFKYSAASCFHGAPKEANFFQQIVQQKR